MMVQPGYMPAHHIALFCILVAQGHQEEIVMLIEVDGRDYGDEEAQLGRQAFSCLKTDR